MPLWVYVLIRSVQIDLEHLLTWFSIFFNEKQTKKSEISFQVVEKLFISQSALLGIPETSLFTC